MCVYIHLNIFPPIINRLFLVLIIVNKVELYIHKYTYIHMYTYIHNYIENLSLSTDSV